MLRLDTHSGPDSVHVMRLLVFFGRHTVFLPEDPVEAGIIPEPVFIEGAGDICPGGNGLAAALQAFFGDVLMDGNAEIVLEIMGNVILGEADPVRENVQGEVLCQMSVDEQCQLHI